MIIALGAKIKLQFINGTLFMPDENGHYYAMWRKVDSTVLSWILNTLSKELSETFVHTETSKQLWDTICQCYGENNGPLKYKIKIEIRNLTQSSSTIVEYFN